MPAKLPAIFTEYAQIVLGCASINPPSRRPIGTNMSTVNLRIPKVIPSPTVRAKTVTHGSRLVTPPQMTKSSNVLSSSLVFASPPRTTGMARHARSTVNGVNVCRNTIGLREVRLPRPRPRKHAIRILFCR